jgi:hypothetical protein
LEPDRVPGSLSIEPRDSLIREGDEARLRVTVLDQDGAPFPSYPSWAPPEWSLSDPEAVQIDPDGRVLGLAGGDVRVRAELAGLTAWTNLRVNPLTVALSAPLVYLVQAAQSPAGDVPIVAGRDALLRVFATGDRVSFYRSTARASFYLGAEEVHSALLLSGTEVIPDAVDESRIDRSFNAVIPGAVLQPGVEMVVELNADGGVPLAPESRVRVPTQGRMPLDVRVVPRLDLTVVPVLQASNPNPQIYGWTGGLTPQSSTLRFTRLVLPVGELSVEVHEPYTTSADLTTTSGWNEFLREMSVLRIEEGSRGYYYGATVLPPGSAYGGLGYIGSPISVGRPTTSTLAHELGHNMSLRHAPCGSVSSFDPGYPHSGGSIGSWGYDFGGGSGLGALVDPDQYKDLMGYCTPRWVSDYHFSKALAFRIEEEGPPEPEPARPVLLLWGSARDEELLLEPTFVLEAPPALPVQEGPYRLEGLDVAGGRLFTLSFAPRPVERGGAHFAFAVPLEVGWVGTLAEVTLSGPRGSLTVDRSTRLRPMALVTDEASGRIRAILRDAAAASAEVGRSTRVKLSRGLPEGLQRGSGR